MHRAATDKIKAAAESSASPPNGICVPPTPSPIHPIVAYERALGEVNLLIEATIAKLEEAIAASFPATIGSKSVANTLSEKVPGIPSQALKPETKRMIPEDTLLKSFKGGPKAGWFRPPPPRKHNTSSSVHGSRPAVVHKQPLPGPKVAGSGAGGSDPDATESDPDMAENDPDATESDPDMATDDPDATESDPDMAETDPDATESDPDMAKDDPDAIESDPDMAEHDPDATESDPDMAESNAKATEVERLDPRTTEANKEETIGLQTYRPPPKTLAELRYARVTKFGNAGHGQEKNRKRQEISQGSGLRERE
ncbi:MAG: hypothetical protein Q9182_002306 [Xanthomendoza sp. 2 TL-2023]